MATKPPTYTGHARLQRVFLRRAVDRTRFENHALREITRHLQATDQAIRQQVAAAGIFLGKKERLGMGLVLPDRQQRLAQLLTTVAGLVGALSWQAINVVRDELPALIDLEGRMVPRVMNDHLHPPTALREAEGDEATQAALGAVFNSVPNAQLTELLGTPLGGAHYATSFGDLATTLLIRLRNILLSGLTQGLSVPQVTRLVRRVMGNARYQAERIVRSEFVRVANQAALVQFEANQDVLDGVQWLATLDRRTCLQCATLDGKVWPTAKEAKVPVVDTHPNCRCTLIPVVKPLPGLTLPPKQRASPEGPVPGTVDYETWFKEQSPLLQREILGPTRYRLWYSGRAALPDFVSARGVRSVRSVLASLT